MKNNEEEINPMFKKIDLMFEAFDSLTNDEMLDLVYELGATKAYERMMETMAETLHELTLEGKFDGVTTFEQARTALLGLPKTNQKGKDNGQ